MAEETLAVIPKSQCSQIRVVRSIFKCKPVIDIRVWFKDSSGEFVRSRKGFTIEERNFHKFAQGIESIEF